MMLIQSHLHYQMRKHPPSYQPQLLLLLQLLLPGRMRFDLLTHSHAWLVLPGQLLLLLCVVVEARWAVCGAGP
jgi:uncharacterized membrane protein YwaF